MIKRRLKNATTGLEKVAHMLTVTSVLTGPSMAMMNNIERVRFTVEEDRRLYAKWKVILK